MYNLYVQFDIMNSMPHSTPQCAVNQSLIGTDPVTYYICCQEEATKQQQKNSLTLTLRTVHWTMGVLRKVTEL